MRRRGREAPVKSMVAVMVMELGMDSVLACVHGTAAGRPGRLHTKQTHVVCGQKTGVRFRV